MLWVPGSLSCPKASKSVIVNYFFCEGLKFPERFCTEKDRPSLGAPGTLTTSLWKKGLSVDMKSKE